MGRVFDQCDESRELKISAGVGGSILVMASHKQEDEFVFVNFIFNQDSVISIIQLLTSSLQEAKKIKLKLVIPDILDEEE